MARVRWIPFMAVAWLLSACLHGDDGPADAGIRAAELSTVDSVAAQAGAVTEMADALESASDLGSSGGGSSAPMAKSTRPRAVSECPDGGTVDRTSETKDADSPFTDQQVNASIVVWELCTHVRNVETTEGSSTTTVVLDGRAEHGTNVEPPPNVFFSQHGENRQIPLHVDVTHAQQTPDGSSTSDFAYRIFARRDGIDANPENLDRTEIWHRMNLDGSGGFTGQSPGGSFSFDFDLQAFIGSPEGAFVFTSDPNDNNSQSFDGEYGFRISPEPPGSRCHSGRGRVTTVLRLVPDPERTNDSPYTAGKLQFDSNGGTATVEFNSDGTVTVTDSEGRSRTMPYEEFASHSRGCAGFAFGGFGFAAAGG